MHTDKVIVREKLKYDVGHKKGVLTILGKDEHRPYANQSRATMYKVKCDCGKTATVPAATFYYDRATCGKYCLFIKKNRLALAGDYE